MRLTQKILDKNGVLGVIDKSVKSKTYFFQFNIMNGCWILDFDPKGRVLTEKIKAKKVSRYHEYQPQRLPLFKGVFLLVADGKKCTL